MSGLALVKSDAPVTQEHLELVRRTIAVGATDAELQLYLFDCSRLGVHPLDRMLHFTKRGGRYTPITSIDLMRARAAETGECAGIEDPEFGPDLDGYPMAAKVTVYRLVQGQRCQFSATARWGEYFPGDAQGHMWKKMPHTMLGKCAEALALRKAFPKQLHGLYERAEMDQAEPAPTIMMVTEPEPALGEEPARGNGYVLVTEAQEGSWKKDGRSGRRWRITHSDGQTYSTIKESVAARAIAAKAAGEFVIPILETKGSFTNLIGYKDPENMTGPVGEALEAFGAEVDEAEERDALYAEIQRLGAKAKLTGPDKAQSWATYVGADVKAVDAPLEALSDLKKYLLTRAGE